MVDRALPPESLRPRQGQRARSDEPASGGRRRGPELWCRTGSGRVRRSRSAGGPRCARRSSWLRGTSTGSLGRDRVCTTEPEQSTSTTLARRVGRLGAGEGVRGGRGGRLQGAWPPCFAEGNAGAEAQQDDTVTGFGGHQSETSRDAIPLAEDGRLLVGGSGPSGSPTTPAEEGGQKAGRPGAGHARAGRLGAARGEVPCVAVRRLRAGPRSRFPDRPSPAVKTSRSRTVESFTDQAVRLPGAPVTPVG